MALPLPASALPLELPPVESYLPSGTGESALANVGAWVDIWYDWQSGRAVPASGPRPEGAAWARARRETNTMPQWAGSCWYYLRYTDPVTTTLWPPPRRSSAGAGPTSTWGAPSTPSFTCSTRGSGTRRSTTWARCRTDEPFRKLFHQGIILGEDGEKMSKSRGNVVSPDTIIEGYGADSLRLYLMFLGPLEAMKPWNPRGIEGVHRFLQKVWRDCVGEDGRANPRIADGAADSPSS